MQKEYPIPSCDADESSGDAALGWDQSVRGEVWAWAAVVVHCRAKFGFAAAAVKRAACNQQSEQFLRPVSLCIQVPSRTTFDSGTVRCCGMIVWAILGHRQVHPNPRTLLLEEACLAGLEARVIWLFPLHSQKPREGATGGEIGGAGHDYRPTTWMLVRGGVHFDLPWQGAKVHGLLAVVVAK